MPNKIDLTKLYRLPYSKNDNPNGWLEITTCCNARCPGCYRGCDIDSASHEHKTFEAIKEEIVLLKQIRNCQTISISGGEALLHPDILEIVEYIKSKNLNSLLYTNGILVTEKRLRELKKAGLNGIIIRIDTLRNNGCIGLIEADLNAERNRFLDMIKNVGGILPAFTAVIDKTNIGHVTDVIQWGEKNEVGFLVLIARRDLAVNTELINNPATYVFPSDLAQITYALPGFRFASYLGSSIQDDQVKWVQSFPIVVQGIEIGYGDAKFVELMQVWYHYVNNRYCYVEDLNKTRIGFFQMVILAILNHSMRSALYMWLKKVVRNPSLLFTSASLVVINFVFPPSFINGTRDLCDGCPDAMLYNGRLVPSCLLEEIKKQELSVLKKVAE